jgi:hypothetical protein
MKQFFLMYYVVIAVISTLAGVRHLYRAPVNN